ncbi:DUF1839 family protein [Williamsia maris]|uniref:DUF1839 domain-containing protein n=1 Tax=Williamsia maris TaxID=72806 RepID=A0ABT1HHS3_9NOCA|nr:DUF1839 family protein [Williamsia maris]MCP2176521.1 protein of unknown function (DUF1839) [Williamsia maris]
MTLANETHDVAVLDPDTYRAHHIHTDESRIWSETNCYVDLWIEILHASGYDPVPSLMSTLSADHDGQQWTFIKPEQADLRTVYGVEVTEEALWRPILDTVEAGPGRGLLHTVEVDSWWLPDTAGSDYRTAHVKTTIVPLSVDRDARRMTYLHNAGAHRLVDDDFDGVFGIGPHDELVLPPYVEQIRFAPERARPDRAVELVAAHLRRRPVGNPIDRLSDSVHAATAWLPNAGLETFHRWAFTTLRQCGSTAELASDLVVWLDRFGVNGAAAAREPLLEVASGAKTVQFAMARAARGRSVDPSATLIAMASAWAGALDTVADALR